MRHSKPDRQQNGSPNAKCKKLAFCAQGTDVELRRFRFFGTPMRGTSKTYIVLVYGGWCILAGAHPARAQGTTTANANPSSCATVLASDSAVGTRIGPTSPADRTRDTATRARADIASFGVGGARKGAADVLLLVGVHADEVRFASQPHVRARLCWGGDTLRVVQRDNLPSPVVPGTTYRNVYIAVELVGRINAECLANMIGVGNNAPRNAQPTNVAAAAGAPTSVGSCAFLGGSAGTGAQNTRPPPQ